MWARINYLSLSSSPGELEIELTPQGTLAEKLRAGGAASRPFIPPQEWVHSWRKEKMCANSRDAATYWSEP
jgi:acyl CoA:acetate/3-ketoacid CoA transferase alpha subunit